MIIPQLKLYAAIASVVVALGGFAWIYYQGKEEAREECLAEQAKVVSLWVEKLEVAESKNRELARQLTKSISEIEEAARERSKRVIEYVESDPTSSTVIFDAAGLSLLNDAQKNRASFSE